MMHSARQLFDARSQTPPILITSAPATAGEVVARSRAATVARVIPIGPVPRRRTRAPWVLPAAVAAALTVLIALGVAGYLLGSSALGAAIAAGIAAAIAVLFVFALVAVKTGGRHCPGCPE